MRPRRAMVLLVFLAVPHGADAGFAQTATARHEGKVVLHADHVGVGDAKIPWGEVLYLVTDEAAPPLPRPHWVFLKSGERWPVALVGLKGGQLTVRSELFGEAAVGLAALTRIEFAAGAGSRPNLKLETLYRAKDSPVPGKLLALDGERVTLDTLVGVVHVPRDGLSVYLFSHRPTRGEPGTDEVALLDGTVLRGKLTPEAKGLKLEHPVAGTVLLPFRVVRSLVRHRPGMLDVTELLPQALRTTPLLGGDEAQVALFQVQRGDGPQEKTPRFIKGVVLEPKTVVRYGLPDKADGRLRLRGRVLPLPGAQGDVVVRIKAGKETLWERELAAGGAAQPLDLDLPAVPAWEVEVDFPAAVRFPCGAVLADAHLLAEPKK